MTSEAIHPDIFATGVVNLEACSESKVGAGRFTLTRILGRGGMGIVWLARDELLACDVALKFLPPQIRFDSVALDDLRRETSRSRTLTHPNIIRIHDFYDAKNEEAFISMEYVEGANLGSVRVEKPERVLSWDFLAPLVAQLCEGLEYAHVERVIHRDLKPANLMLDVKGRIKLADFGIAQTLNDTMTRVSMNPGTSGTLLYMSPQQLEGKAPRVTDDIYAVGATLYELLTSKPPFFSGDFLHQVRNIEPSPLNERLKEWQIINDIPSDVERVILACLAKDESKRPQSARELAIELGLASCPKPMKFRGNFFRQKKWLLVAGAIVSTTLLVTLASTHLFKKSAVASIASTGARETTGPKAVSDPWDENLKVSASEEPGKSSLQTSAAIPTPRSEKASATSASSAAAAVIPENLTALQLIKLGDHYVNEEVRDQVIQVVSEKTVGDLTPKNWRVIYHSRQATFGVTEVQFAEGKMSRVFEPNRLIQMFSPGARKTVDLSQVKLDSDDALKIILALPEVRAASVIALEMQLERGYGGLPVWTVNLFGESQSKVSDEKDLGTVSLLADSGKVLKNTLVKKAP